MIDAAETGLQAVSDHANAPSGELRVTIPAVLAQSALLDRIGAFSVTYPKVRLVLDFSDNRRELISGGFDVAIRMGWLKDSTLMAKKLYDVERRVVAAPTYLATKDPPRSPEALASWDWIAFSPVQAVQPTFSKAGETPVALRMPPSRIAVNDANALCRLACAGVGLGLLLDFLAEPHLHDGTLDSVVDDWTVEPVGVYAVWHGNAPRHGLAKLFVDSLSIK